VDMDMGRWTWTGTGTHGRGRGHGQIQMFFDIFPFNFFPYLLCRIKLFELTTTDYSYKH
jgi:hypothetical protein